MAQLGSGSNLAGFISLGLVPGERRLSHDAQLCTSPLLAAGCPHSAALLAALSTGAATQACDTAQNRGDSDPHDLHGINRSDSWLEIAPVHSTPRGEV